MHWIKIKKSTNMTSFVYSPKLLNKSIIVLVFVTALFLVMFHKRKISRSGSWEPLASVILNSRRSENKENLVPRVNGIPKIVHQIWKSNEVPLAFKDWMKSWIVLNPDWEYWFWTDEDMREFINKKYPQFISLYDSYPLSGYRADAIRYFILYEYGGVYADLDMESLRPIVGYIEQRGHCFLSQEPVAHAHFLSPVGIPLVSNALMGCSPGHPFFADVIRSLPGTSGFIGWADILRATGPYMLTSVYKSYTNTLTDLPEETKIDLAEPDDFHPTMDHSMVDRMREMCIHSQGHDFLSDKYTEKQNEICPNVIGYDFSGKPASQSYTNHHWTHSWGWPQADQYGITRDHRKFHVRDLPESDAH